MLLRALAIIIAILGVLDPAITSTRSIKPEIALVATDSADSGLAAQVADQLSGSFTVIPAPFARAAATVLVGSRVPEEAAQLAAPAFAVIPERAGPTVTIERVSAPSRTPLSTHTPVVADVRVTAAAGKQLELTLNAGGIVLDRVARTIATADTLVHVPLQFVPAMVGSSVLRVSAAVAGVSTAAVTDVVIDVREPRSAILFFDRRPSWLSTFVRRAVEEDPRFVVSSRIVTSRNISTDAGGPPSTLTENAALALYDVIVVGAPELLSGDDVAGLEQFLRGRGGAVVLLPDNNARGPVDRLAGVQRWSSSRRSGSTSIKAAGEDSVVLRASEVIAPAQLPAGATAVASADSTRTPVIWQSAVGAGRLIVSGALDAWRYRGAELSGFDAFWRTLLGSAAEQTPPPIDIRFAGQPITLKQAAAFTVTVRTAALTDVGSGRSVRSTVSAALVTPIERIPLRLWPDGAIGRFRGTLHAPAEPGVYTLAVSADGASTDVPVMVVADAIRAQPDQRDLLEAWTNSRGGTTISSTRMQELVPALEQVLQQDSRRVTWYPLRSVWWIIPFAVLLGAEWWIRRRHGLM